MPRYELDLNPVSHLTADAIGQPGQRVFYLQGWQHTRPQPVTIILEKIQLQSLVLGVEQMLKEIQSQHPDLPPADPAYDPEKMRISPPVDPLFRAGDVGLGYEPAGDRIVLQAHEIVLESGSQDDAALVRFWCTRSQALQLAGWAAEVIDRGRPLCPQCGQPMEAEGHFCPKKNGHKKK